jgi:hypothetical protein
MNRFAASERRNLAALNALKYALSAVRCAATLLATGATMERDRGLGLAILKAVNAAETAVRRIAASPFGSDGKDPRLN